jgi:hypothetical protein
MRWRSVARKNQLHHRERPFRRRAVTPEEKRSLAEASEWLKHNKPLE